MNIRLFVLVKKNLLRFIRNPKTVGFLVLIPVVFYLLLGLIFGGISFEDTTSIYYIGWIDGDESEANYEIHPYYNLDFIHDTINKTDAITLVNYTSRAEAGNATLEHKVDGFIYFPPGFEEYLENNSQIKLAFWNDDGVHPIVTGLYNHLAYSNPSSLNVTDITENAEEVLENFDQYEYDGILIVNESFVEGIFNDKNVNMTYLYRVRSTEQRTLSKNYYLNNTLVAEVNSYIQYQLGSKSNASITEQYAIPNSTPYQAEIHFEISFIQSISPATQYTLESIISQIISGVINNKPEVIELDYDVTSIVGQEVNNITFSAPGYILYGPMTILSFALVILTGEKKEGIYKRLASSEVKNWEIILSNILSNTVLVFMQLGIGAVVLFLFGWNPIIYSLFDAIVGVILTMFLLSFFLLALAIAFAPIFKDPDTAGGGVWIIIIPLMMVSGIFVPIELFGEGMKAIAAFLPTRFAVVILQRLLLDGAPLMDPVLWMNFGLLALYSAIIFGIGIKLFNKFVR